MDISIIPLKPLTGFTQQQGATRTPGCYISFMYSMVGNMNLLDTWHLEMQIYREN